MYCATARELEGIGGSYFNNCFRCPPSAEALNTKTASCLWQHSENMVTKALKLTLETSAEKDGLETQD